MLSAKWRSALGIVLGAAFAHIAAAHDPGYNVVDLGRLPGDDLSCAVAINNVGEVVGWSENFNGNRRAFYWADGSMIELPALADSVSWEPVAINDLGQSVGFVDLSNGTRVAVKWDENLQVSRLVSGPGVGDSFANDINELGQVVGSVYINQRGGQRGFIWENGNLTELPTLPGGGDAVAEAISEQGIVVGTALTASGATHAVIWQNAVITDLGTLGGQNSAAMAINNRGQITGWSELDEDGVHAFAWEDGVMTDLGSLGSDESWAVDINKTRWIVGSSILIGTGELNGVLWRPDRMINLNSLLLPGSKWAFLVEATGVNNPGQVVGQGISHGRFHAFLLEPMLGITAPIPGVAGRPNTFDAPGATPRNIVHFLYSLATFDTPMPGCPGVYLDLRDPIIMGRGQADDIGHAVLTVFVPEAARNRTVFFQSVERSTCEVSAMLTWQFF